MSDTVIAWKDASRAEGMPRDVQLREDGVYLRVKQGDEQIWQRLCSRLEVLAWGRDISSGNWGRLVALTDPDGVRQEVFIANRLLVGDGGAALAMLLDRGLHLERVQRAGSLLIDLLQSWRTPHRVLMVDRLGWTPGGFTTFLAGLTRTIGATSVRPDPSIGAVACHIRTNGTLEEWRRGVAAPALGNPLLMMGLCQAFTGPLLEPLGMEGGGVHLRGPSSRGKTTLLRGTVSVWGAPPLLQSWRATDNGLEGVAAALNGTLCALDEIGEAPARIVGEMAYMLANGTGKARAGKRGDAVRPKHWRLPILSSGEMSLADKLAEVGMPSRAGMDIRLLDLPADIHAHGAFADLHGHADASAFAQAVKDAAAAHHGHAGPAFVEDLLEDFEAHLDQVRQTMERFRTAARVRHHLDTHEGQVNRALDRFALMAAAGELAGGFGLTGWPVGAAEDAMQHLMGVWIARRGGLEPAEKRQAILRVRGFIGEHGGSRFEDLRMPQEGRRPVHDRAGYVDDTGYWFLPDPWKDIHRGADAEQAARYLAEAGYLVTGEGNRIKRRAPVAVQGRPRLYCVSNDILGYE